MLAFVDEAVELASTGIDMPLTVGNVTTALGLIVVQVVAGLFAFLLVRMGLAWACYIGGGTRVRSDDGTPIQGLWESDDDYESRMEDYWRDIRD